MAKNRILIDLCVVMHWERYAQVRALTHSHRHTHTPSSRRGRAVWVWGSMRNHICTSTRTAGWWTNLVTSHTFTVRTLTSTPWLQAGGTNKHSATARDRHYLDWEQHHLDKSYPELFSFKSANSRKLSNPSSTCWFLHFCTFGGQEGGLLEKNEVFPEVFLDE